MGIFSRFKRTVKSKANAAVEKAISPEKELELAIAELDQQRKKALKDLLDFRTNAKQMEQEMEKLEKQVADWESKAKRAVTAGDDELAKQCLARRRQAAQELVQVRRDRDEAAGYAIELNRSRKQFEAKLKVLKLKKGSMARQIAAVRSGSGNALGVDTELFDKLDAAEEAIDEEAIRAEVEADLDGTADIEERLAALPPEPAEESGGDDPLAALKAKMAADEQRKLPPGDEGS